jgi:hypothetical protein
MRPSHAVSIEPGSFALELELGYQNTWALSPAVERYLLGLEQGGRRKLDATQVDAIRNLPGENYLVDVESAVMDATLHYKLSHQLTVYAIASAVSYQGGFLDSTIEEFHQTFGFSSFGRHAVARNEAALIYDLKGSQVVFTETPTDGGLLDPTFGVRYTGIRLPSPWHFAIDAAAKTPINGRRELLSTGRADFGLQTSLQRHGLHHAFYLDVAGVYYAGASDPAEHEGQVVPTVVIGYEYKLSDRTHVNIQGYVSKSVYSHAQTDLEELLGTKYQYSIGFRHRMENWLVTFGVTENVQNVNNTPDIGFQMGLAFIPKGAR